MRYQCWYCGKCVTSELPSDSVIRAILVCPECIEQGKDQRKEDVADQEAQRFIPQEKE